MHRILVHGLHPVRAGDYASFAPAPAKVEMVTLYEDQGPLSLGDVGSFSVVEHDHVVLGANETGMGPVFPQHLLPLCLDRVSVNAVLDTDTRELKVYAGGLSMRNLATVRAAAAAENGAIAVVDADEPDVLRIYGLFDKGEQRFRLPAEPGRDDRIAQLHGGGSHFVLCSESGRVFTVGTHNLYGHLGRESAPDTLEQPSVLDAYPGIRRVDGNNWLSAALTRRGDVAVFGRLVVSQPLSNEGAAEDFVTIVDVDDHAVRGVAVSRDVLYTLTDAGLYESLPGDLGRHSQLHVPDGLSVEQIRAGPSTLYIVALVDQKT